MIERGEINISREKFILEILHCKCYILKLLLRINYIIVGSLVYIVKVITESVNCNVKDTFI